MTPRHLAPRWTAPACLAATVRRRALGLVLLPFGLTACGGGDDDGPPICSDVLISVDAGRIYGQLCRPARAPNSKVLQVLVHGATYDHTYWNFPGFDQRYAYSLAMNRAGYSTLAIDQLGVGKSSHPPSSEVTYAAAAKAVAQVIDVARAGTLGETYSKVVLVGHSIGSLVSVGTAAQYRNIDGLLLSGFSHSLGASGFGALTAGMVPALQDPVITAKTALPAGDTGYLSVVGGRAVFYQSGDAEAAIVTADENSRSEMSAFLNPVDGLLTDASTITVPVLVANGVKDIAFCNQGDGGSTTDCSSATRLRTSEASFFSAATPLEAYVLADAGHNLNLTRQAQTWYRDALAWFQTRFPVR